MEIPKIISFNKIIQFEGKTITINEWENFFLFDIKRLYWINYTSPEMSFSEHAHKALNQIIVCMQGKVDITLESVNGDVYDFILDEPSSGLFIPAMFWKKIKYKNPCILLCLASEEYDEHDYIRDYKQFKQLQK